MSEARRKSDQVNLSGEVNVPAGERLIYIDNIRWLMIVFVVLIHLNCTYGNIGRWYYQESTPGDVFSIALFATFGSWTQAYFMGLLFLIAGYFVPSSYDKKGWKRFIGDRLVRLGIPALIYMAVLHPLTLLIIAAFNHYQLTDLWGSYRAYLTSIELFNGSGPLWFVLALLVFSMIYALLRLVIPERKRGTETGTAITHTKIVVLIGLIALLAFAIRLLMPIGTAVFNMQICYFAQYVFLFPLGIIAYRRKWLASLPGEMGYFWLGLVLRWGTTFFWLLIVFGDALRNWNHFAGGWHWQAAAYAVWESFFCVGMCLGLLVLFRDKYNTQSRLSRFLSENAFGVYVFHTMLLVAGTMAVREISVHPLVKMFLMSIIMLPVCFGFSYLVRKTPLGQRLFS